VIQQVSYPEIGDEGGYALKGVSQTLKAVARCDQIRLDIGYRRVL